MPHPIIQIDELAGLVINELVEASPPAAVSLALTCRSLKEPTLSLLWRKQRLLSVLVKVLPSHTSFESGRGKGVIVSDCCFPVDRT